MRKVRKSIFTGKNRRIGLILDKPAIPLMIGLNPMDMYASKVVLGVNRTVGRWATSNLGQRPAVGRPGSRRGIAARIKAPGIKTSGIKAYRWVLRVKSLGELDLILVPVGHSTWQHRQSKPKSHRLRRLRTVGFGSLALLVALSSGSAHAADKKKKADRPTAYYTPMPMDSGYGPMDLSEPPIAADEITKRFTAKESVFRDALNHYTYRRTVRVQTISEDGKVDGEYYQVDDVIFDLTGKRVEKVVYAPANTLVRIGMTPADFQDLQERLPFVLTSADAGQYDIKYIGRQKVDEVSCYVFEVAPKVIEKNKRYFQGKIWVDADELEIVVTSGKNVPDDVRPGHEDLSTPFTTYREQIDGTNWFPTYTKGDGVLHFPGGRGYLANDVHVRQTVKYSDYKQYGSSTKLIYDGQEISDKPQDQKPDPAKTPAPPK